MILPHTRADIARMDSSALKTVLRVQAHGSIAGAARSLDMDPSSVSRTLGIVEAELGMRLFHRTTRKLSVTGEGQKFLSRIVPVLEELDAAKEEASGVRTLPSGLLRMTASVAFSYGVLVPLLPEFNKKFPDITIDVQASDTPLDLLEEGIDLAIRLGREPDDNFLPTRLARTRFKAVASPRYLASCPDILHPDDLADLKCLKLSIPGLQNLWRFQKPGSEEFEADLNVGLQSSSPLVLRQAALAGMGVALIADWMVERELKDGRLIQLFPDYQCTGWTDIWALCTNTTYVPQKVRAMIDYLTEKIGVSL